MVERIEPLLAVKSKFTDRSGKPLNGGLVYTYVAGTTNLKPSYSNSEATIPNTNPVVLDANGGANIYIKGAYSFRVTTSDGELLENGDRDTTQVADSNTADSYAVAQINNAITLFGGIPDQQDTALLGLSIANEISNNIDAKVNTNGVFLGGAQTGAQLLYSENTWKASDNSGQLAPLAVLQSASPEGAVTNYQLNQLEEYVDDNLFGVEFETNAGLVDANLNTIINNGLYIKTTTEANMLTRNFPVAIEGYLQVIRIADKCVQTYTTKNKDIYIRAADLTGGVWQTWSLTLTKQQLDYRVNDERLLLGAVPSISEIGLYLLTKTDPVNGDYPFFALATTSGSTPTVGNVPLSIGDGIDDNDAVTQRQLRLKTTKAFANSVPPFLIEPKYSLLLYVRSVVNGKFYFADPFFSGGGYPPQSQPPFSIHCGALLPDEIGFADEIAMNFPPPSNGTWDINRSKKVKLARLYNALTFKAVSSINDDVGIYIGYSINGTYARRSGEINLGQVFLEATFPEDADVYFLFKSGSPASIEIYGLGILIDNPLRLINTI